MPIFELLSHSVSQSVITHPIVIQPDTRILKNITLITGLGDQAAKELERAIQDLHEATCVRFRPWSGEADFVSFELGSA